MWQPGEAELATSNVARFMRKHGIESYDELVERSQEDIEWFWAAVVEHLGIEFFDPYTAVVEDPDTPFAKWFVGGTTNLAHNCVYRHARGDRARQTAVLWQGEDDGERSLTYAELRREVSLVASGLIRAGIGKGDTVAIYLPMVPENVIAFYACAAIGAIAVPVFSGFAASSVRARLEHSGARAVICADGTYRRGRVVPMKQVIDEARAGLDHVEHVVVVMRTGTDCPWDDAVDTWWHDLTRGADADFAPLHLDSEFPVMLAYTSGTTGTPKAAVHVHGGFTVKIAQEAHFQTDIRPEDRVHWVTDMGWIMGPWKTIGTHANAGTLVLFEGAPNYPHPDRLWCLVEKFRIDVLGISPTLIRSLEPEGDQWHEAHDLSSMRILASTGEPWNADPYRWLAQTVAKGRCPIINLSGGTEVGACFLSPTPLSTLHECSLGGPALGMAIEVRDPRTGLSLGPGEGVGELVCTKPWPGMTRGFWGEGGREKFLDTYWSRWPGVWVHGDWASIGEDGEWYLHGRSDDTINIAGKRIGPAEYESILVDHPSVAEAATVGMPDPVKGEQVWCFVVLAPNKRQSVKLRQDLQELVAREMGKAFKPAEIYVVKDLPKTRSAKIVRRAIRATAMGEELADISAVENPTVLRQFSPEAREDSLSDYS